MNDDQNPFEPCTPEGLADEWLRLNKEIGELRKSRDHIESILLGISAMNHNGKDLPWREGSVIEGQDVKLQAIWRLVGERRQKWEPQLQVLRESRNKDKEQGQ